MASSPTDSKHSSSSRPLVLGLGAGLLALGVVAFLVIDREPSSVDAPKGATTVERLHALREEAARRDGGSVARGEGDAGAPDAAGMAAGGGNTRDGGAYEPGRQPGRLADRQRPLGPNTDLANLPADDASMGGGSAGSHDEKKMKRKRRNRGDDVAGDIAVAPQPSRHTILETEPDAPYDTQAQTEAGDLKDLSGDSGSVSFWLQPGWDATSQDDAAFVTIGEGLRIYKNVNFLRIEVTSDTGQKVSLGMPMNEWKAGEWQQVAASWGDDGLTLYVNGKVASQNVHMRGLQFDEEPKLQIGTSAPVGRPIASGILADVQVRNRSLTPFDASRRFYKTKPPNL